MPRPPSWMLRAIRLIDGFTSWTGRAFAWLMLPLVIAVTYEVVARYAFHAPTIWAYDLTYMLYGALFMLGAAYTLLRGAHIRTDIFWVRYSDRTKGLVDLCAYLFFFFPGLVMIALSSYDDALYSLRLGERSEQTAWQPILWPFKAIVPLSACLLLIQGVSEVLKCYWTVRTGKLLEKHEEIQL